MHTIEEQKYTEKELSDYYEAMGKEVIYDASRELAINLYSELQMLEDEGRDVGELKEEVFQKLLGYAEEDKEERLLRLRDELKTFTDLNKELNGTLNNK